MITRWNCSSGDHTGLFSKVQLPQRRRLQERGRRDPLAREVKSPRRAVGKNCLTRPATALPLHPRHLLIGQHQWHISPGRLHSASRASAISADELDTTW